MVDASVWVHSLADPEGQYTKDITARLEELCSDGGSLYIVAVLTPLEIQSGMRGRYLGLSRGNVITPADQKLFDNAIKAVPGLPVSRIVPSQDNYVRAWELRDNFTTYDSIYLAVTETLVNEHDGQAAFATADGKLVRGPKVPVPLIHLNPLDSYS